MEECDDHTLQKPNLLHFCSTRGAMGWLFCVVLHVRKPMLMGFGLWAVGFLGTQLSWLNT